MCGPGLFCTTSEDDVDDHPRCLPSKFNATQQVFFYFKMVTTIIVFVSWFYKQVTNSECIKEQIAFDDLVARDNGSFTLIGSLMTRPICDGDGNYGPIKCTPGQTCVYTANFLIFYIDRYMSYCY